MVGITKRFGSFVANDNVDLQLHSGEVLALLGENGAGKTTLMNCLFGHYVADEGSIKIFGEDLELGSPRAAFARGVSMVHQHFALVENHTVLENMMLGSESLWGLRQDRDGWRRRIAEVGEKFGLEVDPDAFVGSLTVGERQRVEIAKAVSHDSRILILDEPTAVLTPLEVEGLFDFVRDYVKAGNSVIIISHKLGEPMSVSNRIQVLRHGKTTAVVNTAETNTAEVAAFMIGRVLKPAEKIKTTVGKPVIELKNVTIEDKGEIRPLLDDVSLVVHEGEILGVAGVSGNGQRPLAELLCGVRHHTSGEFKLFGETIEKRLCPWELAHRGVARVPEDRLGSGLSPTQAIWENMITYDYASKFSKAGMLNFGAIRSHTERLLKDYDVAAQGWRSETRQLSGGNIQKVILARELDRDVKLIVASQPTRGLDVGAQHHTYERFLEAQKNGAGVVLVSEDLDEILLLSDRIAVLFQGRIMTIVDAAEATAEMLGLYMAGEGPQAA